MPWRVQSFRPMSRENYEGDDPGAADPTFCRKDLIHVSICLPTKCHFNTSKSVTYRPRWEPKTTITGGKRTQWVCLTQSLVQAVSSIYFNTANVTQHLVVVSISLYLQPFLRSILTNSNTAFFLGHIILNKRLALQRLCRQCLYKLVT